LARSNSTAGEGGDAGYTTRQDRSVNFEILGDGGNAELRGRRTDLKKPVTPPKGPRRLKSLILTERGGDSPQMARLGKKKRKGMEERLK